MLRRKNNAPRQLLVGTFTGSEKSWVAPLMPAHAGGSRRPAKPASRLRWRRCRKTLSAWLAQGVVILRADSHLGMVRRPVGLACERRNRRGRDGGIGARFRRACQCGFPLRRTVDRCTCNEFALRQERAPENAGSLYEV